MLRNRKAEVNNTVKANFIDITRWEIYFRGLYQNQEHAETPIIESKDDEDNIIETAKEDIHRALKTLKNRKGPGYDDIVNKLLKYGEASLEKHFSVI